MRLCTVDPARTGLRAVAASLLVLVLAFPLTVPAVATARAGAAPETLPVDIVIAVDESGSLTEEAVAREIEATSVIAQSVLNPRSRVTVLGFGSDNGEAGQSAVDEVCRPTVTDGAVSLQYLATCPAKLHRRTEEEGNDTDHVAVLAQALATFRTESPENALKIIFLLTDGELDVRRSPAYGSGDEGDPALGERRNHAAEQQLQEMIERARQEGVQIWPLGFGPQVTQESLERFAAGGSRVGCDDRPVSQPVARIARTPDEVDRSLSEAYAAAICGGTDTEGPHALNGTHDLKIEVPPIATDGTITVRKGDPSVTVEFLDPEGRAVPADGRLGDSSFTRSGENTSVEALRIVNPMSGTWTIRMTAPDSLGERLVSATVLWQGAVQAAIVPEPPTARPGQQVTVRLSLVTRTGALTGPEALRGLALSVQATGDGLPKPRIIPVRDDGQAPDDTAHDGRFAGTFTAPDTAGALSLTGVVTGPGIRAERVPVTVRVGEAGPAVQGRLRFEDAGGVVYPGSAVRGALDLRNTTDSAQRVRLRLSAPSAAAATVSPQAGFAVPPGDSTREFTVTFGADAALGGTSLTLALTDEADPATVYANGLLTVTVDEPPTFLETYRWQLIGAAALILLIVLVLWQRRRAWKRRVGVKGLCVSLTLDGERVGPELNAPSRWAQEFRFIVRDPDGDQPRLLPPRQGGDDPVFTARRRDGGGVLLRTPEGDAEELSFGAESGPLPSGHRLVFRDTARRRRRSDRRGVWKRPAPQPGPTPPEPPGPLPRPTPDFDDPWF